MTEDEALFKAIREKPDDRLLRLIYADWLDEHGDRRGELIRMEEEIRTLPIHSDRYWELKPRRRVLQESASRHWLTQLGYGGNDYQPVFADIPDGWKERWRLIREFTERWYEITVGDIGGPPKPIPSSRTRLAEDPDNQSVDSVLNDSTRNPGLSPSLREWLFFIRDLQLGLENFGRGSGDRHLYFELGRQVSFLQGDGGREHFYIPDEHRHEPDPQVWWEQLAAIQPRETRRVVAPRVTTLAIEYLLNQYEPQFRNTRSLPRMTKRLDRRLTACFPVRSHFDQLHIFERTNAIAMFSPNPIYNSRDSELLVMARSPEVRDEVQALLWG